MLALFGDKMLVHKLLFDDVCEGIFSTVRVGSVELRFVGVKLHFLTDWRQQCDGVLDVALRTVYGHDFSPVGAYTRSLTVMSTYSRNICPVKHIWYECSNRQGERKGLC